MCEIAIMIEDVTADDPIADSKMFKRGDVISVLEDGADWGDQAIINPRFRMVRLPGVSVSEASVLVAGEMPTDPSANARTLRPRMIQMDLADPSLTDALKDVARSTPVAVLTVGAARRILNSRKIKKQIPDPDQIGSVHSIGIPVG